MVYRALKADLTVEMPGWLNDQILVGSLANDYLLISVDGSTLVHVYQQGALHIGEHRSIRTTMEYSFKDQKFVENEQRYLVEISTSSVHSTINNFSYQSIRPLLLKVADGCWSRLSPMDMASIFHR